MGRKPKLTAKKDKSMHFRFTTETFDRLKRKAELEGVSMTHLAEQAILKLCEE